MDEIRNAQEEVEKAKVGLIQAYLDGIIRDYRISGPEQRIDIQQGLEKFLTGLEDGKIPRVILVENDRSFSSEKAKEIRLASNFTIKGLAEELGLSKGVINSYEIGKIPKNHKNLRLQRYLSWLKEQGYNPFNI